MGAVGVDAHFLRRPTQRVGTVGRLVIGLGIVVVLGLLVFNLWIRANRPTAEAPHLVSMGASAQALAGAGSVMQAHGQAMLDEGQRIGDQDLRTLGEHWLRDGQALSQRAQWLTMNPLAPASLVASPGELSRQDSWGELPQTAEAMLHDPSHARELDLEALRWNGQAMSSEGRLMQEHGQIMAEDVEVMIARHNLAGRDADELRAAAATMHRVGDHLTQNGQAMMDYADRLRRSMGRP